MKIASKLLTANTDTIMENQRKVIKGSEAIYYYNDIPILIINRDDKTIIITTGGNNSNGMNKAINNYLNHNIIKILIGINFQLIDKREPQHAII